MIISTGRFLLLLNTNSYGDIILEIYVRFPWTWGDLKLGRVFYKQILVWNGGNLYKNYIKVNTVVDTHRCLCHYDKKKDSVKCYNMYLTVCNYILQMFQGIPWNSLAYPYKVCYIHCTLWYIYQDIKHIKIVMLHMLTV